jgi:hypothetical protein
VNEIQIIRSQLATEQSHAAQIVRACAAAFGSTDSAAASADTTALFREACVSYLAWVLARFEERDQTLSELLGSRQSLADEAGAARMRQLGTLLSRPGTSREALSRLKIAFAADDCEGGREHWQEFARFFDCVWAPRRLALEGALTEHLSVADWRAVCAIDADSMLDERNGYARAIAHLPPGIEPHRGPPAQGPRP